MENPEKATTDEKRKERSRHRSQHWRDTHPGYAAAANKKRYGTKRVEILIYKRRYDADHKDQKKNADLKNKLGITLQESTTVKEYQHFLCAICGLPSTRLCNDHDHKTGLYRGILCWRCNNLLGGFGDSIERLLNAIVYLTCPPAIAALNGPKFGLPGRIKTSRKRREMLARKIVQVFERPTTEVMIAACLQKIQQKGLTVG